MSFKKVLVTTALLASVTVFASEGKEIFKKCAICHGLDGGKKSLNVSEKITGWNATKIINMLKLYNNKEINKYGLGKMMRLQATKLDDAQMIAVALYIEELKPAEAKKEFKERVLGDEERKYNAFFKDYFQKNRSGTTKEAQKLWKQHLLDSAK